MQARRQARLLDMLYRERSIRYMLINTPVRRLIERDGACGPGDWNLFVSGDAAAQEAAKEICESCQVRESCLSEYFLEVGIVVGGTSWSDRKRALTCGEVPYAVRQEISSVVHQRTVKSLQDRLDLTAREATRLLEDFGDAA